MSHRLIHIARVYEPLPRGLQHFPTPGDVSSQSSTVKTQVPDHVVAAAAGALKKAASLRLDFGPIGINWSMLQVALEPKSHPVHAYVVSGLRWKWMKIDQGSMPQSESVT